MRGRRRTSIVCATLAAACVPGVAQAQAPPNYVTVFVTTTAAYRPPGGPWDGFQDDLTASIGYGRFVTKSLALELDVGATWVSGDYTAFSLSPGLIWSFHPNVYAAARFIVPVDPESNFALAPGIGLMHAFANGLAPWFEVNAVSYVGRGDPDLGISLTAGLMFSF